MTTRLLGDLRRVWLAGLVLASACTPLSPWQRATLQTRVMADPFDPGVASFEAHVWETREALTGASGAGGAPCGCN